LYNNIAVGKTSRLRLPTGRQGFGSRLLKHIFGDFAGHASQKSEYIFQNKKQPVGAMGWWTSMSRIRCNPENIQGMVERMARRSFLRCQRARALGWPRRLRAQVRGRARLGRRQSPSGGCPATCFFSRLSGGSFALKSLSPSSEHTPDFFKSF